MYIPPNEIKNNIINLLKDKKAENIICKNISEKSSIADYIIFASGRSNKNVSAIGAHIADELKKSGLEKVTLEGFATSEWILVDTGSVIVHVMHPEIREEYDIESIWKQPNENIGD